MAFQKRFGSEKACQKHLFDLQPLKKMVLDVLFDGVTGKWHFHIRTYKTVWVMGHKIRKAAMAEGDAFYS
ncbi:MAG: hypothetical protein WA228_10435 [Desulfobaccales bacterium]